MTITRRIMFIVTAMLVLIGIWLTGLHNAHWFLYVTPISFWLFALTGACPSTIIKWHNLSKQGKLPSFEN